MTIGVLSVLLRADGTEVFVPVLPEMHETRKPLRRTSERIEPGPGEPCRLAFRPVLRQHPVSDPVPGGLLRHQVPL